MRKLGKWITNNFGLKVLAAVIAVLLWLIIVNVEDPNKTQIFTMPVTIENEDYLEALGKTYEVLGNTDEISFTISGKRSIVEELTESDFTATANLENIDESMTKIPITINSSRYRDQIEITKKSTYVEVEIENLVTETYKLEVVTTGNPAKDCFVSDIKVSPKKVTVTGPASVVAQIDKAQAKVDIADAEEDIAANSMIQLVDPYFNEVNTDRLTMNRTEAAVDIEILASREVEVSFGVSGVPKDGFRYTDLEADVEKVTIVGNISTIEAIDVLEINSPKLKLKDATEDFKAVIHIQDFLPDGVTLDEGSPDEANVTVHISGIKTNEYKVPKDNIEVEGLDDSLKLALEGNVVPVNLTGYEEDLESIKDDSILGKIDLTGLAEGKHAVPVSLNGNFKVQEASATVVLTLKKPKAETDEATVQPEAEATAVDGEN